MRRRRFCSSAREGPSRRIIGPFLFLELLNDSTPSVPLSSSPPFSLPPSPDSFQSACTLYCILSLPVCFLRQRPKSSSNVGMRLAKSAHGSYVMMALRTCECCSCSSSSSSPLSRSRSLSPPPSSEVRPPSPSHHSASARSPPSRTPRKTPPKTGFNPRPALPLDLNYPIPRLEGCNN